MMRLVYLDAGPLGLATNPRESDQARRCREWLRGLLVAGARIVIPEVADYEVRRELMRADRPRGIARLESLAEEVDYDPIDTRAMRKAAELWARARQTGNQTADNRELDCDVVLAAQARLAAEEGHSVTVATTNVGHLGRFVDARMWDRVGVSPLDVGASEGLSFFNDTNIDDIIDKDVDVYLKAAPGEDHITSATLCRTFVKDGRLWIDSMPTLDRRYIAEVPRDAIISRNDVELSVGRFGVFIDATSEAGRLLYRLIEAKKKQSR